MTDSLRIYAALIGAGFRGQLQYRANFVIWVITGLVYQLTGFAFIWVVLERFGSLAGWTLGEVAFLYGLRLLGHGTAMLLFARVEELENLVREAEFDRILVRPTSTLVQVFTRQVHVAGIGDFLGGLGLFIAANRIAGVDWSPPALAFLALTVLGAALIECGLKLLVATLSFRFMSTRALIRIVDDVFSNFGNYPMRIFGSLQFLLTFGLPVAFVAYLPSTVLLARTDELSVHPAFAYLAPGMGAVIFGLAVLFWRREIRHYQSAGH